jgi:hypothetical protein
VSSSAEQGVRIGLSAVVITLRDRKACVLTTAADDGGVALPFGPFDPARDRTFELALRNFVTAQTGFRLGFVEQLYTFGDLGRASPRATPGPERQREVSVGYLALTADSADTPLAEARWTPVLDIFPWEDRRAADPPCLAPLLSDLTAWAARDPRRQARIETLFATTPAHRWSEGRVLDRYELLYEAGVVAEAARQSEQKLQRAAADADAMAPDRPRPDTRAYRAGPQSLEGLPRPQQHAVFQLAGPGHRKPHCRGLRQEAQSPSELLLLPTTLCLRAQYAAL